MFKKLLIANRGEIACRIIKTAKQMGIKTVAVYSDPDRQSPHVLAADEAYPLYGTTSQESYLDVDKILKVIKKFGIDAVHPGYGFLSENSVFRAACDVAGVCFIGPSARAIEDMGCKARAKQIMQEANVPVVPGYEEEAQDLDIFAKEAKRIGYPVLLKAAAGGGGKGMRVVEDEHNLEISLQQVKREALKSFGSDKIILEKLIESPRHIEVQVFADKHGQCIHLWQRDCSVQRRHQKIIEEAPGLLEPKVAQEMGEVAVQAAKAIAYEGAGTIEFLLDAKGSFYFMEMNTRLQVEHPVTEMVTALDLVQWQLQVAAGEALPLNQAEVQVNGYAIEARIYAEEAESFLPQTGTLTQIKLPEETATVRVDTGVAVGDNIGIYYDPMLMKVIVWGNDRGAAIKKMQTTLAAMAISGVKTNLKYLQHVFSEPDYQSNTLSTAYIEQHHDVLSEQLQKLPAETLAILTLGLMLLEQNRVQQKASISPWETGDSWRLIAPANIHFCCQSEQGKPMPLAIRKTSVDTYQFHGDGQGVTLKLLSTKCVVQEVVYFKAEIDELQLDACLTRDGTFLHLQSADVGYQFKQLDHLSVDLQQENESDGSLLAPMPGVVIEIKAAIGSKVKKGEAVVVMEAMKMEHIINAPYSGTVSALNFSVGSMVPEGHALLVIDQES